MGAGAGAGAGVGWACACASGVCEGACVCEVGVLEGVLRGGRGGGAPEAVGVETETDAEGGLTLSGRGLASGTANSEVERGVDAPLAAVALTVDVGVAVAVCGAAD